MGGILAKMAPKTIGQDDVQIGWTQVHFFSMYDNWNVTRISALQKKVKSIWNSNEKDERAQEKRENLFFVKIKRSYIQLSSILFFIDVFHVMVHIFFPFIKINYDWCHQINSYFHEKWCNTFFVTFEMTKHC